MLKNWFKFMSKKDRKIKNLEVKVVNRDKLIDDQARTIEGMKAIINSLEDDLKASRAAGYEILKDCAKEQTKKTTKRATTTKKKTTKKETTSKKSATKK